MSVILADLSDVDNIIEEEKAVWVYDVLIALGADEDILADIDKADERDYLFIQKLEVINNFDNSVDIFRDGHLVAQWKHPKIVRIKKKKEYYCEIHLDEWALPFQMQKRGGT